MISSGGAAVVHEWVAARAGSEQVFERLAALFPGADLHALSADPTVHLETGGRPITTTLLDRSALRDRRGLTLPLMPPPSKRMDGAIRAAELRHDVTFVHRPSDDAVRELYRTAVALIFPTVEDFGIVPVEAQAAGTPVIAPREGGAVDTAHLASHVSATGDTAA